MLAVWSAISSNNSIKMLAMIGERGDPSASKMTIELSLLRLVTALILGWLDCWLVVSELTEEFGELLIECLCSEGFSLCLGLLLCP